MRITSHGHFLTQLTKFPRLFPVNCYLVHEEDGLTLIDAAIPGCEEAILAAAQRLGAPIRRIVLTHAHADHVGSLDALRVRLPEAEVLISARDARLLAGDKTLDADEPQAAIAGGFQKVDTRPTRLLADGDSIGSLQVIAAPGHTPGHIALLDTRDRSLVAGDAFQTRAGLAVSGTLRLLFPFPALATWHRPTALAASAITRSIAADGCSSTSPWPTALASARRLVSLNPARLAVGHGEVLEQPSAAMERVIAEAASGLKETTHGA
jgi:glyoxylase-like metal-dependent hydrolase (beta-lactamase superfamily II)